MSLFATTQKLIEETLFYWTKEWVPELAASKGWDHPEQTELNYVSLPVGDHKPCTNGTVHPANQIMRLVPTYNTNQIKPRRNCSNMVSGFDHSMKKGFSKTCLCTPLTVAILASTTKTSVAF